MVEKRKDEMNQWTKNSFTLSTSTGYLDRLHEVYPVGFNPERKVSADLLQEIIDKHSSKDPITLVESCLKLEKFPIDNSYVGALKASPTIRANNPETMKEIGNLLLRMTQDELVKGCKQPKKSSRQMGPHFHNWLKGRGYTFLPEDDFISYRGDDPVFLDGSDGTRKGYVNKHLAAGLIDTDKGLDIVMKKSEKELIGEAKFISRYGGTQGNQFNSALRVAGKNIPDATCIAVLDGVAWFDSTYKNMISARPKDNILSALLLEKFIEEF